ncbi:uncharacterized protein LOC113311340 [Papaver somniferum]|uniref:uncharacterized protein LOC113311340 n=1 Tax=Papaver somniferum TaxID=3469 RepID=UPI000E700035|nr:uncharacterized protein LOC113311340 [Papaver somniferum]
MFNYLYSVTIINRQSLNIGDTVISNNVTDALRVDLYDVALDLLKIFPTSATIRDAYEANVFSVLAGKPFDLPSGNRFGLWRSCMYLWVGSGRQGSVAKLSLCCARYVCGSDGSEHQINHQNIY